MRYPGQPSGPSSLSTRGRQVRQWGALLPALILAGCQATWSAKDHEAATTTAHDSAAAPAALATAPGDLIPAVVGLPPEITREAAYRVGPDDVLRIEVFKLPELTSKVRVNEQGYLTLPLLGEVPVQGLTAAQIEARIAAGLAKDYVQNPQVNVFIETYANLSITVSGAVAKPGVFPLVGKITLLEAVALAGGATRLANTDEVVLFREQSADQVQAYIVDMAAIEAGKLRDPLLTANDKVRVPESGAAVLLQTVTGTLRGFVSPL